MNDFKNQTVVITGAASGIGAGLARKADALGMKIVIADRDSAGLKALSNTLKAEHLSITTDVSNLSEVEALATQSFAHFGQVDLLFNNAGVMTAGFMWEVEPERWQKAFDVNVNGVMNGIRAFVPRLMKQGTASRIINTSSIGGFLPSPMMAAYTATKAAVVAITESLIGELEIVKAPIKVSLLAPGPVKTGIMLDPFGDVIRPEIDGFMQTMRAMLNNGGLEPDAFASRVFEGIARGDYWLIPQPEVFDDAFKARVELISTRQKPKLPDFG